MVVTIGASWLVGVCPVPAPGLWVCGEIYWDLDIDTVVPPGV